MEIIISIIGLGFGITFFLADYYEQKHPILPTSFIAGFSVGYFFLIVLPEISTRLPEYPLHLSLLEYFFVLIGFVFIHVSEKFILQRVEKKTQKKLRELIKMETTLEAVEQNIENLISAELMHEKLDEFALKDMSNILIGLNDQGKSIKNQIEQSKIKIHDHINKEFEELRFFTNFSYHFLIGIILFNLLIVDFISAIFFYIFAFFRAIISNRLLRTHTLFTDLDIQIDYEITKLKKIILASAALIGMFTDIVLDLFFPINLEILYLLFSFISGVILYSIVREVIPEKEKGNPIHFLIGVIGFTIIVIIVNSFTALV